MSSKNSFQNPKIITDSEVLEKEFLKLLREKANTLIERADTKTARSFILKAAQHQIFIDKFEQLLTTKLKNKVVPAGFALKNNRKNIKRTLNLNLSDLHIGANLDPREVPLKFSCVEEARRLAFVVQETVNYKPHYRENTDLVVNLLGDIIQGQLHDPRDGNVLAEQVGAAIWLLTRAIAVLAKHFPFVTVNCNTGNHGRNTSRHNGRGIHQKWDSFESHVYLAIANAFSNIKNVKFNMPLTPYITYDLYGQHVFGTHGDTVLNVGYPGSVINIKNIETRINKINAARPNGQEFKLFFVGHVHTSCRVKLPNGVVVLTNGPLIPPDGYALSIGNFSCACSQTIFESVPGYVVGDYREIDVNQNTDKDSNLDKIIAPYPGGLTYGAY